MTEIRLVPLAPDDREQFILDNQEAFNYGALEEFGRRDDHFEEDDQIISRETIETSIDIGEAYRIMQDGQPVGGVIMFCLEYLLCGLGILVFNKVFHLKISGHICGIIGPMVLLVQNNLPAAILVGFIILLLVATASLKINRHTIPQMIGGGIVPLISFGILLLLFRYCLKIICYSC